MDLLWSSGVCTARREWYCGGREGPCNYRVTSLGCCLHCICIKWGQNTAHKLLWSNRGALKEIRLGLKALGLWVNKNFNKNGKYSPGPWYNISPGCWCSISQSYNLSDIRQAERVRENCVGQRFQKQKLQKHHQFSEWASRTKRQIQKQNLSQRQDTNVNSRCPPPHIT